MVLEGLAAVLVALGVGLEIWAVIELGWRRALDVSDQAPDPALPRLVFAGPFRLVRHPQSFGLLLVLAGAALIFRSPRMWLGAGLAVALVAAVAIRDDRELGRQFGEAYARYRRTVPLLLPLPRR